MIKPKGWIDDIVVYPAIFGQKATLSSMNELFEIPNHVSGRAESI